MVQLNIFKQYDVRGIYPNEINEKIFYKLARACSRYFNGKTVLVGRDGRLSSPSLKKSVIEGLIDEGLEVYDLDLVSTSTFNFIISSQKFDFGIQITASHNPKEYNGMKIYDNKGNVIGLGMGLEKIKEIFEKIDVEKKKKGKVIDSRSLKDMHKEFLLKNVIKSNIKFALDFSNGVGSIVLLETLKDNYNFYTLNEKIDGNFPSHSPEPNEESLMQLKNFVILHQLDFGACFDGDADRIVFVSNDGKVVRGDQVLYLFSRYLNPKKVVCEISFPPKFTKILKSMGIEVWETKVGRSFIVNKMRETDADLGGEISCHFYFRNISFMEDAFYSLLLMIKILENEKRPLADILKDYEVGKFLSYKVKVDEKTKYELVELIKKEFKQKYNVIDIDGVKVIISEEDWFLIRASNTEPIIRVYIESSDNKKIEECKSMIDKTIEKCLLDLK